MRAAHDGDPVYERFQFLMNAPALFNAVATSVELGIFHFLADRAEATFDQIHQHTALPLHQLRVLLQAVCSTGLLTRRDGRYANSAVAQDLLASDDEDSWAHIIVGWKEVYYPAFGQMTTALRAGTNTALDAYPGDEPTLYQRLSRNPDLEAVFHRAMSAFTLRSVDALVERPEFAEVRHLLDVGGGDGTTSIRLAARHPQLKSTIFDIPSVSRIADGKTTALADRVDLLSGNMFTDNFPLGPDAVLFSHVLEIFSAEQILAMLQKAYDVLPVGGRVFLYGYNVSDDETSGIFSARLGLYFNVLASGQGMAYPAADYERWLSRVGFRDVTTVRGLPFEHGLSMGTR
ncbi:methyltransferase [Micromonospora rifamycinica]|uniref:Dimerisation domain-containing protein n=1 Tax=Micromonospora rifamycinica TaxID=291594 RepID=A0A125Q1E2_9ACTN|nr:methyltransferase [Micromonospora rifamycinica]KWV31880.1 methyltransferase [Micromonospora rifamycinica]SCG49109.1 Dimerisation domain-containing protein [Micromonospora rifamycinica]